MNTQYFEYLHAECYSELMNKLLRKSDIQERWDARKLKRTLQRHVGSKTSQQTKKINGVVGPEPDNHKRKI